MNCSMARRVLILLWGAGACLYPLFSYALGVGDLQVESRLNQPLRARIEVSDVSDDEWHQLRAHFGSQQSQADGLSRPGLLESVTFKNVEDENHRRFIDVKSVEPFTEPLFDLSIEVAGIDASVTRNYTVFLDPPGPQDDLPGARGPMLASQPAAPVRQGVGTVARAQAPKATANAQSATQAAATVRRERSMVVHAPRSKAPAASAASGAAVTAPATTAKGATSTASYTVTKADTLEKIARRFGGTTASHRGQFMDWVFQHNPTAFYGDMNRLRAGARLALPESAATAGAQVAAVTGGATGATATAGSARAPATADALDGSPVAKAQLQGELAGLQQELTSLQKMIAQQDAQIASLKQQIAARDEQRSAPTGRASSADASSATVEYSEREAPSRRASASDDQPDATRSTEALAHADASSQDEAGRAIDYSEEPQSQAAQASGQSQPPLGGESHSRTTAPPAQRSSDNTGASPQDATGILRRYHLKTSAYYWFAGIALLAAVMVWLLFHLRRRLEEANPDVQLRYPIGPNFERSAEAPQPRASLSETLPMIRSVAPAASAASKLSAALKRRELNEGSAAAPGSAHEHEQDHDATVEEPQTGLDTWRTQTALLEQDILSETDVLPFVLDSHNQLKAVDEELLSPSELTHESREIVSDSDDGDLAHDLREEYFADTATSIPAEALPTTEAAPTERLPRMVAEEIAERAKAAAHPIKATVHPIKPVADRVVESTGELPLERSATNQDIVKALESSLDYNPDRVDIQLKLLEIYHHEAMGNRENFHTMLRKLAELKDLSPAQRLHVEMLQRTLQDGDSSFVAEEEI